MELKITKEKVLEAASKCSTAKETLKVLFPEAFVVDEDSKWTKFGEEIGKFMNSSERIEWSIWKSIPVSGVEEKGIWVADLVRKTLQSYKNG